MTVIRSFLAMLNPPFKDQVANEKGLLSPSWTSYFNILTKIVSPLGSEKSFSLKNNLAVAEDIEGLSFTSKVTSHAVVEYLIQRITDTNEVVAAGIFNAVYKPTSDDWSLVTVGTPGPSSSGITFSITNSGQVKYTSSDVTGTVSISKITWRARTLAAKSSQYSVMGGS